MKNSLLYIWLQQCLGLYSRIATDIFSRFSSIEEIYHCDDFSFLDSTREKYIKRLENKDTSNAFETLKRCETLGVKVTGYYDELYPEKLKSINMPPVALYSIGNFKNLNKIPCVAIVGTRDMTVHGREITEQFAYNFAKSGVCVVSGLAKGIDTAAHRGAVMADGYTVAVLGNPIGDIYPRENEKAFKTLYERGLVISELYPGCGRTRADFPNRNRIISGISDAVVVTEAGENSGSLITARHAVNQGKRVYAVPGSPGAENAGTNRLIKDGTSVATEANDVLLPLSLEHPQRIHTYEPSVTKELRSYGNRVSEQPIESIKKASAEKEKSKPKNCENVIKTEELKISGDASQMILESLFDSPKPLTADEISASLKMPVSEVMAEITFMEIDGTVISSAGGRYSAANSKNI